MTVSESLRLRAEAGLPTEDDDGRPVYSLDNGYRAIWPPSNAAGQPFYGSAEERERVARDATEWVGHVGSLIPEFDDGDTTPVTNLKIGGDIEC